MFSVLVSTLALADPCGMVPPLFVGNGPAPQGIERQGLQQTYTFFRDGVQTIAIRPGFTGDVDQFGMLVPLPAVPALRKIDDRTFEHLRSAVDPPVVRVQVVRRRVNFGLPMAQKSAPPMSAAPGLELARDEVRVVKEEAVGMYEVAVLEAGSARALQRWMDDNAFRYPAGMDRTVEDYVRSGWMFVAIKTRVGAMAGVTPRPGQRSVNPGMPDGASFDGFVQGMAFRFRVDEPVVPMRLAVFNGDDTHNRVFVLSEGPSRINEVPQGFVRRQVSGRQLYANVTEPLDYVVSGGGRLRASEVAELDGLRNPEPYVAAARDLMAADIMAASRRELSLPFEESEKELLRINEALGLRGAEIDVLVHDQVSDLRGQAVQPAVQDLAEMTLTVVDGSFDPETLSEKNLTFSTWRMPPAQNRFEVWNDRAEGPQHWVYR
ncbi:MAG: DUF2330 domain-containing protein [Myxococcales bacterium]|nr:DUF2330 domain-containing protein [Myxococcales bacterium]